MKPLSQTAAKKLIREIPGWTLAKDFKKITKVFLFPDFKKAVKFVNTIAKIAESEGHHPDISIWYNKVGLDFWTHSIGGLSDNDFIVAAKINNLGSMK